jgi:tRNA G18 (ribose-2'-O)-methylase SpoU
MRQRTQAENNRLKGGLRQIKSSPKNEIYIILDNIKSMYNVGAIFRTAEAIKAKKIYLCGITATPPRREIYKVSMGAVEFVDWEYVPNAKLIAKKLKDEGVQIVALEQTDKSIDYKKAKYKKPIAIVLGHEGKGVSKDILKECDLSVEIPMLGRANSLNVATSAGIILYQVLES